MTIKDQLQKNPNSDFYPVYGGKYYLVRGSYWSKIKTVIPGTSATPEKPEGEKYDESWAENDATKEVRSQNGIYVNDKFLELWDEVRGIMFLAGGYGSSKTTYVITRLLVKCMENEYFRCYYGRQKKTEAGELKSNIITEIKRNGWQDLFDFSEKPNGTNTIIHKETGNMFKLFGCDDVDSLKGIDNPTDIVVDEINQISFEAFGMLFTRLRGSGYVTQMIGMFNNCDVFPDHWLRKFIYGNENSADKKEQRTLEALRKNNIVRHHSDYLDNHFQNPDDYYYKLVTKANGDEDKIQAYCKGEWGIVLNSQPYYKRFDSKIHINHDKVYDPKLPLHLSWDENVNPYLPLLIIQVVGNEARIIDEITAENPFNELEWVCGEVCRRYEGHDRGMYIYGDATSRKEDVKLEKGKNYFTLICQYLKEFNPVLCVPDSNPNNKLRGDFINGVFGINYAELSITVYYMCQKTIEDLIHCQEDPKNGGKLKDRVMVKGIRGVQKYGHLGDCLDYFACFFWSSQYMLYQSGTVTYNVRGGTRVVKNSINEENDYVINDGKLVKADDLPEEDRPKVISYKRVSRNAMS